MKKLTVVGMGPGEYESMTLRAVKALNTCDVIVGYTSMWNSQSHTSRRRNF